jgi:hypothetical protein
MTVVIELWLDRPSFSISKGRLAAERKTRTIVHPFVDLSRPLCRGQEA